jgi:chitinase
MALRNGGYNVLAAVLFTIIAQAASRRHFACYFSNWAGYREGNGKFEPENIDPNECTHLMYGYGIINTAAVNFQSSDAWADLTDGGGKGYYERFNALKRQNPDLKTLLALGGGSEDYKGLWKLAEDPEKRKTLITRGINFVKQYGFDGVELAIKLPSSAGGSYADRENMGDLITEMVALFHENGLILTATIPPVVPPEYVNATDYHAIMHPGAMEFVSVSTMEYHGPWESYTHHTAPLYAHRRDADQGLNTNASMNAWTHYSARDPSFFLLGIPTQGKGWALEESTENDFYAKVYGPGMEGPYTKTGGTMGFLEICEVQKKPETVEYTEKTNSDCQVPYAVFNNFQWWGYDNPESAARKAQYVIDNDFGGVMLYTLELDDTRNVCGLGKNSIGMAIKATLEAAVPSDTTTTELEAVQTTAATTAAPQI